MKAYTEALDIIKRKFDDEVYDLGKKVREEVILPVCKQHKLRYVQGMGRFFFSRGDKTYGDASDNMSAALREVLTPIFELLNSEVYDNQVLGYYVDDVDLAKRKKL